MRLSAANTPYTNQCEDKKMNVEFSEELMEILEDASEALSDGEREKTEELIILLIQKGRSTYDPLSASAGMVLIQAAKLYHKLGNEKDAAILLAQAQTTAYFHKRPHLNKHANAASCGINKPVDNTRGQDHV